MGGYSYFSATRLVVAAGLASAQADCYDVSCQPDGHSAFLKVARSDQGCPSVGEIARRLGVAVRWMKELDVVVAERLMRGMEVGVSLPAIGQNERSDVGRPRLGVVLAPTLVRRRQGWPLYGYQRIGVRRLLTSERCLLADDMGLGKTLQVVVAITRLLERGECRRCLVVAPTSVLDAWRSEFARWSPAVCVRKADSSGARSVFRECWNVAHVLLTNYEQMRRPPCEIVTERPELLVLDEAHRVKNWHSQVASGIRTLSIRRIWALTGTPLEKGKVDLVGIMNLLDPDRFGPRDRKLPSWLLRAKTRPYTLRREKAEVLGDLPRITFHHERVRLHGAQKTAYRDAQAAVASATSVLAAFSVLRTLCDYDPNTDVSAKLDRTVELVERLCIKKKEKAVVFSYLLKPLQILQSRLVDKPGLSHVGIYQGSLTSKERTIMLTRFENMKSGVLLASMRAAGEGLTLTGANNVLLINRWWNPSSNAQAIDRVHRIGQTRPVAVYLFEAIGTIEERLAEILSGKEELFDDVVGRLAKPADLNAL